MIPKTRHIYEATARAIDSWGDRNHINARGHLAPLLGYRGDNAHIQLSNTLNSTTYNPALPKRLSVDHLDLLLHEVDTTAKEKILSALVEPHGFTLCRVGMKEPKAFDMMEIFTTVINLDKHHGNISAAIGDAVEDMQIDEKESKEIKELISDFRAVLRSFEAMIAGTKKKGEG